MTEDRSPDDILLETVEKMGKAVAHTQSDFASVRTGPPDSSAQERERGERERRRVVALGVVAREVRFHAAL